MTKAKEFKELFDKRPRTCLTEDKNYGSTWDIELTDTGGLKIARRGIYYNPTEVVVPLNLVPQLLRWALPIWGIEDDKVVEKEKK